MARRCPSGITFNYVVLEETGEGASVPGCAGEWGVLAGEMVPGPGVTLLLWLVGIYVTGESY